MEQKYPQKKNRSAGDPAASRRREDRHPRRAECASREQTPVQAAAEPPASPSRRGRGRLGLCKKLCCLGQLDSQ